MADTIDTLARRVAALENELAIRDTLARYCLAADSGNAEAAAAVFGEDCTVDIDAAVFMNGRKEVRASMQSQPAQAMLPRSAHITGPFVVEVNGDKAVATGYMTLFIKGDAITPTRQSLGRWEFAKQNGKWLIVNRLARSVGRDDTKELMTKVLAT